MMPRKLLTQYGMIILREPKDVIGRFLNSTVLSKMVSNTIALRVIQIQNTVQKTSQSTTICLLTP